MAKNMAVGCHLKTTQIFIKIYNYNFGFNVSFLGARTPLKMIVLKLKIVNCIKLCHLFLQTYSIVNPKGFFLFQSIEDLCKGNLPHFYLVLGTNKKDSFVCALILAAASFVFKAKFKYNTNILWLFNF